METQGGSAITRLVGRGGLFFKVHVHRYTNKFSNNNFVIISLISITLSLQATLMKQRALIAASDYVIGFLVTFLLRNMQDGHPFVSFLHMSRAKLTLMKARE